MISEKKLFRKKSKKLFSDVKCFEKMFRVKKIPSVPPSVPQGPPKIPKYPYRATTREEKVFRKIPEK